MGQAESEKQIFAPWDLGERFPGRKNFRSLKNWSTMAESIPTQGAGMNALTQLDSAQLAAFGRKWKLAELALFGSALRDDFRPDSDVDVLVTFTPDSHPSLFDLAQMQEELCALFGREIDIVSRRGIESSRNYLRKNSILRSARVVYAT